MSVASPGTPFHSETSVRLEWPGPRPRLGNPLSYVILLALSAAVGLACFCMTVGTPYYYGPLGGERNSGRLFAARFTEYLENVVRLQDATGGVVAFRWRSTAAPGASWVVEGKGLAIETWGAQSPLGTPDHRFGYSIMRPAAGITVLLRNLDESACGVLGRYLSDYSQARLSVAGLGEGMKGDEPDSTFSWMSIQELHRRCKAGTPYGHDFILRPLGTMPEANGKASPQGESRAPAPTR